MSFLSVAFLYGLAAVAIPITIHLIQRQRYPERRFTTLRFFDKTIKNNTINRRIIDKILLCLRIAALIALMLGLARPYTHTSLGEQRRSIVIVLDNSPSMGLLRDGKTLFEKGKQIARAALEQLGPTDRAELVFTAPYNDPAYFTNTDDLKKEIALRAGQPTGLWTADEDARKQAVPGLTRDALQLVKSAQNIAADKRVGVTSYDADGSGDLSYDSAKLLRILDQSRISSQPGDVKSALSHAASLLRNSQDGDKKIILLSDLQKSEWDGDKLEGLGGIALAVVPIDSPGASGANLGIENCTVPVREADFGQTITGTATIRNYGSAKSDAAKLTVHAGDSGKPIEIKVPPIDARSALSLAFPIQVMCRERSVLCSAQISTPTDPFSYDDSWYFQIGVRFPVQTLCVNGVAGSANADSETFYLMNALGSRSNSNPAAAETKEIDMSEFSKTLFTKWNVLILAGVQTLDAESREKIRQFAADGKGVLIFPGASATAEEYNGWGFLPAEVVEKKTKSFVYMKSIDERATALAGVREHAGAGIHSLSTSSRFILKPAADARVLARFSDSSPALVEGTVGKGRVIIAATGAHVSESDWPLRPAFVILTRSLVKYLGSDLRPTTLLPERTVGDGAATTIAPEMAGGTPALFRVSGIPVHYEPLPWYQAANSLILPSSQMDGHYYLTVQPGTDEGILKEPKIDTDMVPVSFNHSARESDLTVLSVEELQALLPSNSQVTAYRIANNPETISDALHSGRDLTRWILLLALAFLAVEGIVAWRSTSEAAV